MIYFVFSSVRWQWSTVEASSVEDAIERAKAKDPGACYARLAPHDWVLGEDLPEYAPVGIWREMAAKEAAGAARKRLI